MVDDAREVTSQQATAYQPTGKKVKTPKPKPKAASASAKTASKSQTAPAPANERVYIRLLSTNDETTLMTLKQTIDNHQGGTEVVLVLGESEARQAIKLPGGIDKDSEGLGRLKELVGSDNLVIR
jgi:hypothetical protein